MGKLRPYFTESARGAAEGRAERLCREECCRGEGGCRVELQRCAPEGCNREALQRSATERDAEDYCRGSQQRSATDGPYGGRCRGALPGALEWGSTEEHCRGTLQRSSKRSATQGQRNAEERCRKAMQRDVAEECCIRALQMVFAM